MSPPDTAGGADAAADRENLERYFAEGERRAMTLGNRGPIRFVGDGALHPDIVEAYWRCGFYVFEDVMRPEELEDTERDLQEIMARLPVSKGAEVDSRGRPALGVGNQAPTLFWSRPMGDPFGGTDRASGRHPVRMFEPEAAKDAPDEVVYLILGSLQFSEAALRLYGHPDVLKMAAAINGQDFTPFADGLIIKAPGLGASFAWHRDGVTHWDRPDWDQGTHGFNCMGQLYGSTPANGLWVLPGTHKERRVDIEAMVNAAGGNLLPEAVPLVSRPGDLAITNRQVVHGSFPNMSKDWRVTVNFGFHRRGSVLGEKAGGLHNAMAVYDDARIRRRSRMIGYAIDARRQRFPDETPFVYKPHAESGETFTWDGKAKADVRDYNLEDLSI